MLEEYKLAIAYFVQSIELAEKTVDESSPELSVQYERLSISYEKMEQLDLELEYMEKIIPGYGESLQSEKSHLYYRMGCLLGISGSMRKQSFVF